MLTGREDPKAPKRSLSAYMFFATSHRREVLLENPSITFGAIGKRLGQKWKSCSDEEREPYERMAREDKERYEREKAMYNVRSIRPLLRPCPFLLSLSSY